MFTFNKDTLSSVLAFNKIIIALSQVLITVHKSRTSEPHQENTCILHVKNVDADQLLSGCISTKSKIACLLSEIYYESPGGGGFNITLF